MNCSWQGLQSSRKPFVDKWLILIRDFKFKFYACLIYIYIYLRYFDSLYFETASSGANVPDWPRQTILILMRKKNWNWIILVTGLCTCVKMCDRQHCTVMIKSTGQGWWISPDVIAGFINLSAHFSKWRQEKLRLEACSRGLQICS